MSGPNQGRVTHPLAQDLALLKVIQYEAFSRIICHKFSRLI